MSLVSARNGHEAAQVDPGQFKEWPPDEFSRRPVSTPASGSPSSQNGHTQTDSTSGQAEVLNFFVNVPQEVTLKYRDGKPIKNGNFLFTLTDGRIMFLPPIAAERIVSLNLERGEPVVVCKREVKQKGRKPLVNWDIERPGEPGTSAPRPVSTKVPYNVAFGEILDFMSEGLKSRNEQWTDQARQNFVSTVLIGCQREGWIAMWERPHTAKPVESPTVTEKPAQEPPAKPPASETITKPWKNIGEMKQCFADMREKIGDSEYFRQLLLAGVENPSQFSKGIQAFDCYVRMAKIAELQEVA